MIWVIIILEAVNEKAGFAPGFILLYFNFLLRQI